MHIRYHFHHQARKTYNPAHYPAVVSRTTSTHNISKLTTFHLPKHPKVFSQRRIFRSNSPPASSSFATSPTHSFDRRSYSSSAATMAPKTSIQEFQALLASADRVLALCGAGLSAASGLPTFRGAGGLWRNHEPTTLATREAFARDPALVWLFYAWRKHMALTAQPNAGHYALAALAKKKGEKFLCLTQNVDGE